MKHGETSLSRSVARSHGPDLRFPASDFRRPILALGVGALLWATNAPAATAGFNPYSGIVERNSFGLKPPVNPADLVKPPPPLFADIKLQGITTILGRKQVLLKVRFPAKPSEPARDQSLVLSEGQREGEVEVLEINPAEGTIKVNNAGTILPMNMKDNGEKPVPGPAVPSPGISPLPGLPGVPPPALPGTAPVPPPAANPAASQSASGVTPFGGTVIQNQNVSAFGAATTAGAAAQKTIPTRTLRSSVATGGATASDATATAGQLPNLSPEAQAVLIEAQRAQLAPGGFDMLPKTALTPKR